MSQAHESTIAGSARGQLEHTVLASFVQLYVSFGVKHGLDPEHMCGSAGFSPEQIADGNAHVPYSWLAGVRSFVITSLHEVPVGLELGLFSSLEHFGYAGQALKYASCGLDGLHSWNQLILQMHRGAERVPELIVGPDVVHWHLQLTAAGTSEPPESIEALFVASIATIRALTGEHIAPIEVRFSHAREKLRPLFEAFFGCPIRLDPRAPAIVFARRTLELPFRYADVEAGRRFRAQFERRLLDAGDPFCVAVQRAIEAQLARGALSQARTAKLLGTTSRTLQRRLRERSARYQELVDQARRATAMRLLQCRTHSICEVALAIGYDASSFNRVFRRWTGMTPREFRLAQVSQLPVRDVS